ncbi:MAG: hypothetical protein KDA81_20875 [Planctomycetaceae bacterium]|nr:hypothetical protein [Planctomycetaceae bacterium]
MSAVLTSQGSKDASPDLSVLKQTFGSNRRLLSTPAMELTAAHEKMPSGIQTKTNEFPDGMFQPV